MIINSYRLKTIVFYRGLGTGWSVDVCRVPGPLILIIVM